MTRVYYNPDSRNSAVVLYHPHIPCLGGPDVLQPSCRAAARSSSSLPVCPIRRICDAIMGSPTRTTAQGYPLLKPIKEWLAFIKAILMGQPGRAV